LFPDVDGGFRDLSFGGGCVLSSGRSAALDNSSPLQRRPRDIHTAQQHAAVQPYAYTRSGAVRLGIPVRHPVVDRARRRVLWILGWADQGKNLLFVGKRQKNILSILARRQLYKNFATFFKNEAVVS